MPRTAKPIKNIFKTLNYNNKMFNNVFIMNALSMLDNVSDCPSRIVIGIAFVPYRVL